jgi:type I restriction enzyme, S subunit
MDVVTTRDWPKVTIEEVALDVTVGHFGPMADEYLEAGVPFLRSLSVERFGIREEGLKFISPDFHKKLKKSALAPGDVVIVRTGKPGTCAVVPNWLGDANCSDLVIVRCGLRVRPISFATSSTQSQAITLTPIQWAPVNSTSMWVRLGR